MLADFGANVIKIEPPEWKRSLAARMARRNDPIFLAGNRGKKSAVLDMTLPQGREVFEGLVKKADVVLSNFRPSVVRKLGLDYETLGKVNPRIICCNISGFGLKGKGVERPAYELAIQALSGVMSVTGEEGERPVRAGLPIADEKGGMMAVVGILAACLKRQKDGQGQQVDISMFDNMIHSFSINALHYYATGELPGPAGSYSSAAKRAEYRAYETKDSYIVIATGRGEDKWQALCKLLGQEELGTDPRYNSFGKRIRDEVRMALVPA